MYIDALEVLEHLSSTKDKEEMIRGALKWDTDLLAVFDATYRFDRKFFIKQLPELSEPAPYIGGHLPQFLELLNRLETRSVTGDAARAQVKALLDQCTPTERKWFQRILLKDLRVGVGISTVNKAGANIPEFEVMLAKDGKECKKVDDIIKKGVFVSKKFDGYRCLAVVKNGVATLYTRNGKEYENFPTIEEALVNACKNLQGTVVFDGEIMSDDFQSMQKSAFASKRGTTVGDVKYHIFDWIPGVEWETQKFTTKASQRFSLLSDFFVNHVKSPLLIEVEHEFVESKELVLKYERQYLAEGYEGAMVLPDIPYYLGRKSNAMMKFKTMLSMDCEVNGIYEGTGKYAGMMGGFHLIQENGERCDCGSGFTDQDRQDMFACPESVIGRIVEIKYQNLSDDKVMRFPIFVRFRDNGAGSGKI